MELTGMCQMRMNHAIPCSGNTLSRKHWSRNCVLFLCFVLSESVYARALTMSCHVSTVPEQNRRAKTVTFCDLYTAVSSILDNMIPCLTNQSNQYLPVLEVPGLALF